MDKKTLDKLFANSVLNEDTKNSILSHLNEAVESARKEAAVEARKEVMAEFKKNKATMYETVEKYIETRLSGPVEELREQAEQVIKLKGEYADRIVKVEESFKKEFNRRWKALVGSLTTVAEREVSELHETMKVNRRAYLKKMNEVEVLAEKEREQFKKKAALVLENILDVRVQKHLDEHEADLKAAMKSDFGTEIFEAFYSTMQRHFFSTNKEARKLAEALKRSETEKKKIVESAQTRVKDAERRAKLAESSRKTVVESSQRTAEMAKLLAPLKGQARDKMKTILEAASNVESMRKSYQRFLPDVMESSRVSKPASKPVDAVLELKTGGATRMEIQESDEDEIIEVERRNLQRSAGLTR